MGDPPRLAPLDDVAKFAADLETGSVMCRGDGHVWSPLSSRVRVDDEGKRHWTKDCDQCGTVRTVVYTATGHIDGRSYDYPPDYRNEGMGRISSDGRALMRVEMFRRLES